MTEQMTQDLNTFFQLDYIHNPEKSLNKIIHEFINFSSTFSVLEQR